MKFSTVLLSAAALVAAPLTAAVPLHIRDVFVPPILYPHAGTVWQAGVQHNVTWDTANHPVNITNKEGTIFMAKGGLIFSEGPGSINDPLADGFDILLGRYEVTVPDVSTGDDYQLVLLGDSGNFSPNFTIENNA